MARNLNALREPTMNDVLTSIREIIQENYTQNSSDNEDNADKASSVFEETAYDLPLSANQNLFDVEEKISSTSDKTRKTNLIDDGISNSFNSVLMALDSNHVVNDSKVSRIAPLAQVMSGLADSIGLSQSTPFDDRPDNVDMVEQEDYASLSNEKATFSLPFSTASMEPFFKMNDQNSFLKSSQNQKQAQNQVEDIDGNVSSLNAENATFRPSAEEMNYGDVSSAQKPEVFNDLLLKLEKATVYAQLNTVTEEVLRPLISKWLNENFDQILKKIFQEELQKALK